MADDKVTDLSALAIAASDDWVYVVDKSDTGDDPAGSSKKLAITDLPNEYMVSVWAEENAALGASNTYEWAYGNGANTPSDGGITMYVPSGWSCEVVAMSLRVGGGTATVELVYNGTPQGASANVVLSSGQSATDELGTPLSLSSNDYINFRTTTSSGTSGPCVVTAWIRYYK